jgi:reverse gyrase
LIGLANGDKIDLKDKEQTDKLVIKLEKASYAVSAVRQKRAARQPAPPFITSTLQQELPAAWVILPSAPWPWLNNYMKALILDRVEQWA